MTPLIEATATASFVSISRVGMSVEFVATTATLTIAIAIVVVGTT